MLQGGNRLEGQRGPCIVDNPDLRIGASHIDADEEGPFALFKGE
jgi:hypothetical protein